MLSPNTSPATAEAVNGNTTMPADDVQVNNMPTATIAEQHTINGRRTIGFFAMDNEATVATTPIGMMNMPETPAFIWQASSSHWGKAYMTT